MASNDSPGYFKQSCPLDFQLQAEGGGGVDPRRRTPPQKRGSNDRKPRKGPGMPQVIPQTSEKFKVVLKG